MKMGFSINKNTISGRLKSTFTYFMTFRNILILSSIFSQVPKIFPSLTVVKQILGRKVAVFLHNQWNSSIHESRIYLRILEKKVIILRCVRTQKTITLTTSKWKLGNWWEISYSYSYLQNCNTPLAGSSQTYGGKDTLHTTSNRPIKRKILVFFLTWATKDKVT